MSPEGHSLHCFGNITILVY
uniref:Uncharacterized protein n=1 Tax=Rhizophora mucronata TaxID=61149 RepID=A0A2P2QE35_RHIMU